MVRFILQKCLLNKQLSSQTSQDTCLGEYRKRRTVEQPVAINLITVQWNEKYNCAFHPGQSVAYYVRQYAHGCSTYYTGNTDARNTLRQPVAINLITLQWKEKYNCAFHSRNFDACILYYPPTSSLILQYSTTLQTRQREKTSDSPSQSISSLFSGRRSTIASFILG